MKPRSKVVLVAIAILLLYSGYLVFPRAKLEEILQLPHPQLRERSSEVTEFNEEVKIISDKLHEVLMKVDRFGTIFGLGMAAPQIGFNKRIIALKQSYGNYKTMVNPEIIQKKWEIPWIESCFSLEGKHFIKRYAWTKIKYQDLEGNFHEEVFKGMPTIVQQEIDHLNGVLITDY